MTTARGVFIVLEGADGAGKTTHARKLTIELERRGREPVLVREPGGTPIGEKVRAILLDPANEAMDARTELFLFMASRAQLCRDVVRPALAAGKVVVADRFLLSSAVYQGRAGGIGLETVLEIGRHAIGDLHPDLTILLDIDAERSADRVRARIRDRMESRDPGYHRQVCESYRWYARAAKEPVKLIDATRAEEIVFADVLLAAAAVVPGLAPGGAP